jgi:hypothetical protein
MSMNSQKIVAMASFTQTSIGPQSRSTRSAAAPRRFQRVDTACDQRHAPTALGK